MASVWAPGTTVRIQAGAFAGYWGTVRSVDAGYYLPINVEITGVETSIRQYDPEDLIVS